MRQRLLGAVLLLAVVGCGSGDSGERAPELSTRWALASRWTLDVEHFARSWLLSSSSRDRESPEKPRRKYLMDVTVVGEKEIDGVDCAQLEFSVREASSKRMLDRRFRAWVSRRDGMMLELEALVEGGLVGLTELCVIGDIAVVLNPPRGFPVEILDWKVRHDGVAADGEVRSVIRTKDGSNLNVERRESERGNEREVELIVSGGSQHVVIRQMWIKNAHWWTRYERFIEGHRDLRATLRER